MNILYPFPEPLPMSRARGLQTAWMVDALCSAGARLVLASPATGAGHPLDVLGKEDLPATFEWLKVSRQWPAPFQRWHSVSRFVRTLKPHVLRIQPDVIFVRHLKLAFRLIRLFPRVPVVYEAHEVFSATASSGKRVRLAAQEAEVLAQAAGVVYISQAVQRALRLRYPQVQPRAEIVLHSGVNLPESLCGVLPEKDWRHAGEHIVYAGSFFGWKGTDDLVAAAAYLPENIRLTLLGGEPGELERLAAMQPRGGASVRLLPRVSFEETQACLRQACIAVLPNRSEGVSQFTSPLKLFEYMGAGCALVAADLPSVREVLSPEVFAAHPELEDIAWFTPGDPKSLAAALAYMVMHPDQARAQAEVLHALAPQYSWLSRAQALLRFFETVIRVQRHAPVLL